MRYPHWRIVGGSGRFTFNAGRIDASSILSRQSSALRIEKMLALQIGDHAADDAFADLGILPIRWRRPICNSESESEIIG